MSRSSLPFTYSLAVLAVTACSLFLLIGCGNEQEARQEPPPTSTDADQLAAPTPSLAVWPFLHKGNISEADAGVILADLLLQEVETDRYDPWQMYQLKPKLASANPDASDADIMRYGPAEIGQHTGVNFLVQGELSQLGNTYYLSAQLMDCQTQQITHAAKVNFTSFDNISSHLQELAVRLELRTADAPAQDDKSTADRPTTNPVETIEQLYLDEQITLEQTNAGIRLLEADPESLDEFDTRRLGYYQQVADGSLTPDKLQRALDLIELTQQEKQLDHIQQVESERSTRIAALMQLAKENQDKQDGLAAIKALEVLLELDPENIEAQILLANITSRGALNQVSDTWTNSIGMTFAYIPRGSFLMGSSLNPDEVAQQLRIDPKEVKDEFPRHKVTLTKPFGLATTEVTCEQFSLFAKETGYRTTSEARGRSGTFTSKGGTVQHTASWRKPYIDQGEGHPVVHMSLHDTIAFCAWLSKREGRQYRLPTEAEWEYACRAGSTTVWSWGDSMEGGKAYANMADEAADRWMQQLGLTYEDLEAKWDDGFMYTSPVGSFKPNAWGLYDMQGNAWEWCSDLYGAYSKQAQIDPKGAKSGERRVLRGGSWSHVPWRCRPSRRLDPSPDHRFHHVGFRVVVDLEEDR